MGIVRQGAVRVGLLMMVLVVGGCAQVPQQAIDDARAALATASDAEAAIYAESEWTAAKADLDRAVAEVEAQNAKFVLLRSYSSSGELLATATESAESAELAARENKERVRNEVEERIATIDSGLLRAQEVLDELASCSKRPKGFASDLELLRGNLSALSAQLEEVRASFHAEAFNEADAMALELSENVDTTIADLEQAKTTLGC